MYTYFVFVPDLNSWRQQRVLSACQAFLEVIDPAFEAEPLDLDGVRVGWFFHTTTEEARQHLIVFFTALVGRVGQEQANGDAFGRGRFDAAAALDRLVEAAR